MQNTTIAAQAGTVTPEQKRFATLKAQAALQGIAVHQLADGGFLACRWNLTKDVPDLDALGRFLHTMGVRNARS